MLKLKHLTSTLKQREFWLSEARFRLFVGGVGSGKTRAGCVEVLRMPALSTGMIVAPTYAMLRDSTLSTFLELARRGNILADFNKADMTAKLIDGKTLLFRSADDPDRLRGPNLGWFYLDEAALMDQEVWLIMIGRLRESPGRAWATSTPRGINWLYETFVHGGEDYAFIRSSTRENPYLPDSFIKSLETSYTGEWLRQELEGEFIDSSGGIFKREWFKTVEKTPEGLTWVRYWDLAASTQTTADYTASAAVTLASDGIFYIRDMVRGRWEWPDAKRIIIQTMLADRSVEHGIEHAMHGLAAVQELRREREIANVTLRSIRVDRDKLSRALPWAARAEAAKVNLLAGPWVKAFLDEASMFPIGTHDDQVDSVSGGLEMLTRAVVPVWIAV